MTEFEKYLFDLNGFLVVEDALSTEQVEALNAAIDHNRDRISIRERRLDGRSDEDGGDASEGLRGKQGRGEFGDSLFWPEPWCRPFRELLTLPAAMEWMIGTIGDEFCFSGFQGIIQVAGSEGQILHGGGVPHHPSMTPVFFSRFEEGRMANGLMAITYQLADIRPGEGGFCCIPGSHKANYEAPLALRRLEMDLERVHQITARAGAAILFTETLTHGAMPWSGSRERRTLIYRYQPAYMAISQGHGDRRWDGVEYLTPLQRALLEPPYFGDRPNIAALMKEGP
jgi:hypothetical protein